MGTVNSRLEAITDNWQLSKANFQKEVREQINIADPLRITDCTLRDGEQQAGIVFSWQDKVEIAKKIDELGIYEIEVGTPASSGSDERAAREIVKLNLKTKVAALSRATKGDIDLLCDIGVWGANISLPIGDLQRKYKLNWDDERYIHTCLTICEYARSKGLHVNFSPYDTTRVNFDFLDKVLTEIKKSGNVDRVRLVDTVGSSNPIGIRYMVQRMKAILQDIPLEIHVHDDFGLAMANTIAAVETGADVISSTINGIGDRCGNAATEEVVLTLQMLYGIDLGVDCSKLLETCQLVAKLSNVPLHQHKAIVGSNAFAHETGMSVAGVLSMPFTAEAYNPALVGQERQILLGKKSGKASIEWQLREANIQSTPEQVSELLEIVKDFSVHHKRCMTTDEFIAKCKEVL